jgi:hypothetical protein
MLSKNNLKRVFILAFLFSSSFSYSQGGAITQDLFTNNLGFYNPAFIGASSKMNFSTFSKIGKIKTNREYFFAGGNFDYSFNRSHNISLNGLYQRESDWTNSYINIGYSYQLEFKSKPISVGFGAQIGFKSINHLNYNYSFGSKDTVTNPSSNPNTNQVFASVGINFWFKDKVYLGLHAENFIPYKGYESEYRKFENKTYHNAPSIAINVGTKKLSLGDSLVKKFTFEANLSLRTYFWKTGSSSAVVAGITGIIGINIYNIITPRIGFRYYDNSELIFGLNARIFKGLFIGYTYDLAVVNSNIEGGGSHEFNLGYFIPHKPRTYKKGVE